MIIIFCQYTSATDGIEQVLHWLDHLQAPYLRVNCDKERLSLEYLDLANDQIVLRHNESTFDLADVSAVWYWRGGVSLAVPQYDPSSIVQEIFSEDFGREAVKNIGMEQRTIASYVFGKLFKKPHINDPYRTSVNKLQVLEIAQEIGLKVPKTYLLSSSKQIAELAGESSDYITKAAHEGIMTTIGRRFYNGLTANLADIESTLLNEKFHPSLVQQCIEKQYEIRSYCFMDEFYSMAIFSQNDDTTKTDFRAFTQDCPNRYVPYKLPKEIEEKLLRLIKRLGLNCGSFDLIYSAEDEYQFLEVNPVGQWMMTSVPCNYYLEKRTALWLKENTVQ